MEGIKINNFEEKSEKIRDKESHDHIKAEVFNLVKSFLEKGDRKIGKGLSAEVHYFGENGTACVKIISEATLDSTRKMNSAIEEANLQERVYEILEDIEGIIVPRPLFEYEFENKTENGTEEMNVMCMERLKAVSLEEVLDNSKDLPETFNFEQFFNKLKKAINILHDNKFHHRDLRAGNVMIDLETGDPCLIDFALSVESVGEDDPYRENRVDGVKTYPSDESELRKLRQMVIKYIIDKNKNS